MSRPGPPPKPTALRLIQGNPGKRAINQHEPKPQPSRPSCPSHLDDGAKREWRRVVAHLEKLGLLTQIDRAALAAYCQAWSRWVDAEEKISKVGQVVRGSAGSLVQNPYVRIANECMQQIRALAQEFGMTPSSRSRISVPGEKQKSLSEIAAQRADAVRSKSG